MVAEYRSTAIGDFLGGGSDNHHRAALLHVRGVKLLLANIIWLLA